MLNVVLDERWVYIVPYYLFITLQIKNEQTAGLQRVKMQYSEAKEGQLFKICSL